jgi:hypothetical protein
MSAWMKLVLLPKKLSENDHSKSLFSMVFCVNCLKYINVIDYSCKIFIILSILVITNILVDISVMETGQM